jgi:hypothetical protein
MWNTTQSDGTATLVAPLAPVQVDAWNWIPVDLPNNETTVTVTVGGEPVNVTLYWEPTYVGLAASTLVVPPENTATMVLQIQQPSYWVMPYGVEATPGIAGEGTISSSTNSIPATVYEQQQGNPLLKNYQASTSTQTTSPTNPTAPTSDTDKGLLAGSNTVLTIIALTSIVVAALSLTVAIRTRKREPNNKN